MQIPQDWGQRSRTTGTAGTAGTAGAATVQTTATTLGASDLRLAKDDLLAFSASAAKRSLSLQHDFLSSITNDASSLADRVEKLLAPPTHPGSNAEGGPTPQRSDMQLELDTLLSRLPYKKLMQELLPYDPSQPLPSVPVVTRAYEESFMREKTNPSQRECVHGTDCECRFIDPHNAFTAIEFLLPGETAPPTPQPCVLCSRAATQQLFYDIVFDKASFAGLIQRHGNLFGVPNEYARDAMLICPPNGPLHAMPHPIVAHQRNRYTVVRNGGTRSIRQHGVFFR